MEHKTAKVVDGWLVCACGRKLAQVDGKTVKMVCRGTPFTGNHFTIIVPEGVIENDCGCGSDCNGVSID